MKSRDAATARSPVSFLTSTCYREMPAGMFIAWHAHLWQPERKCFDAVADASAQRSAGAWVVMSYGMLKERVGLWPSRANEGIKGIIELGLLERGPMAEVATGQMAYTYRLTPVGQAMAAVTGPLSTILKSAAAA